MASILDAGVGSIFNGIFVFLLVYTVFWGVLKKMKPFGDNAGAYAIIAFICGFLISVAAPARNFITFIAPWFIALAIAIFFWMFIALLFGWNTDTLSKVLDSSTTQVWLSIVVIIILLGGLAFTFGQGLLGGEPAAPAPVNNNGGLAVIGSGQPYQEPGTIAPNYQYGYGGTPQAGEPGSTATSDFGTNLVNTFIHPKVLGMLVTLLIASVAVFFLSKG